MEAAWIDRQIDTKHLPLERGTKDALESTDFDRDDVETSAASDDDDKSKGPSIPSKEAPLPWVDTDAIPSAGGNRIFDASRYDSLNAKDQADIFATMLIAKRVRPPLALGLFGDWGVGKTFYMRLMQESVRKIAGKAAAGAESDGAVSRAAQIEFNAWHYVDSDLWASLAAQIFDRLAIELKGETESVDETRRALRNRIDSSKREIGEAEEAINVGQDARMKARGELNELEQDRAQKLAEHKTKRLRRVWGAVLEANGGEGQPDVAVLKLKAEQVSAKLGIAEVIDSAEELQRVYASLTELKSRGQVLSASLGAAFTGRRSFLSAVVVIALLGVVLAWPFLLECLDAAVDNNLEAFREFMEPLLGFCTLLGVPLAWFSRNIHAVSQATDYLEQIKARMDDPNLPLADPGEEEISLQETIEQLNAQIATEEGRVAEADKQIAEAQAEIQRINAGGLVYDFLEGKVSDSRYLDRLGLISVIRKDFEHLGKLLKDWNKHGDTEAKNGQRPIERIILYIDDLDRCPAERVVEVLQAVHLLLAFDLFVVVVAVDARWLERSLNESYNPRKNGADEPEINRGTTHQFDAHNYLEKIFQIPFSLPAMQSKGYEALVAKLVATPTDMATSDSSPGEGSSEAESNGQPVESGETGTGGEDEGPLDGSDESGGKVPPVVSSAPPGEQAKELPEAEKQKQREEEEAQHHAEEQKRAKGHLQRMLLQPYEEKFIKSLFCFIETPRLTKRFINIYRLIRARTWTPATEEDVSNQGATGAYRAALLLLAISVGRPQTAPTLLKRLREEEHKADFVQWLHAEVSQFENSRNGYANAVKTIVEDIGTVDTALEDLDAAPRSWKLSEYREWALEVGRFSFHWHLDDS